MEASRFDTLVRTLHRSSRRSLVATTLGALAGRMAPTGADAGRRGARKRDRSCHGKKRCGKRCIKRWECCGGCGPNEHCCNGGCISNILTCGVCAAGQQPCNGACIPATSCCGGCPVGQRCCNGSCIRSFDCCGDGQPDQTCCNGEWVDLSNDPENCAECGVACRSGECIHGTCTCAIPNDCNGARCFCTALPPAADTRRFCYSLLGPDACVNDNDCQLGSVCAPVGATSTCTIPC